MYYNIDIKLINGYGLTRKITKVRADRLQYFIELYSTSENWLIISQYIQ